MTEAANDFFSVEGISKSFEGVRAVDGCTFSIEEQSVVGLVGPNGAGKSTVFNLVTGFHKLDHGRVKFRGKDITGYPPDKTARQGIGRGFQIPRPFSALSVFENMIVSIPNQKRESWWRALYPFGKNPDEHHARERALDLLDKFGLYHLRNDKAATLSGGQKKLLDFAHVLMSRPSLVLLDEPAGGVNPKLQEAMTGLIHDLRSEGLTFLIVEHNLAFVDETCDTVIVMVEGKVMARGALSDVREIPSVRDAYMGSISKVDQKSTAVADTASETP